MYNTCKDNNYCKLPNLYSYFLLSDPRLSGLFPLVPTSPGNRGSTVLSNTVSLTVYSLQLELANRYASNNSVHKKWNIHVANQGFMMKSSG